MRLRAARALAGALLLSLGCAAGARAQVTASPLLPPGHWAVEAARRAEALGLAGGFLPAQRAISRDVARAALSAAARAAEGTPAARLTAAWEARFREEFGEPDGSPLRSGAVHAALRSATGRAAPGTRDHFEEERTGATPLEDARGAVAVAEVAGAVGPLALYLAPRLDADGAGWEAAELVAGWGAVAVSAGRQYVAYGEGAGGTVMLSGARPLDRVEVRTTRPVRLPGVLDALGPLALHTFLGRLDEPRHARRPYIWGARGALRPHSRVTVGVQRVSLFGGEGEGNGITGGRVLAMLLGRVNVGDRNEFDFANQQVSAELRLRLPTEGLLPLTAYLEWGSEDAAGAWWDVPGLVMGLNAPALPGLPAAAVGVEWTSFAGNCCGNPAWYRHKGFPGSWAWRDAPLGHPLGGHGTELLVHSHLELADAGVRLDARGFRRDRRADNLFVPGRGGHSFGLSAGLAWRWNPSAEARLQGAREAGEGWAERSLELGTSIFF